MEHTSLQSLRAALRGNDLPAVVVDLAAFDHNLDRHQELLEGRGLTMRLATKSVRVPELLGRALARPFMRGLMCYSVPEAAFLTEGGFDDLFVAYPPWSERHLETLADLTGRGRTVCAAADCAEAIERMESVAARRGVTLRIVLCVDMSLRALRGRLHLGVRRSPLHARAEVLALAERVSAQRHLKLVGVMGYEAQVAGLPDRSAFDAPAVRAAKRVFRELSMRELSQRRAAIVDALRARHGDLEFVNGGGTGSLDLTTRASGVTEVSAGSGLFKPALFDGYQSAFVRSLRPSCFFALEVRRRASPSIVTCFGGGYVASGAASRDKLPVPVWPAGLTLLASEGAGEVQTPLAHAHDVALGDAVLFRHAKAGELMERTNEVLLVERGTVSARAPTYRGAGFSFG